jgi:hypothetical protein
VAVSVNYGGNTYSVPQSGERGWGALTNYLVALAQGASTTAFFQNIRVSTLASTSILTTDFAVLINFAGAATATLPSGGAKQIFAVFDKSGAASVNNITVGTTAGALIDGQAGYVIKSDYGGLIVQFDGSAWKILSTYEGDQHYFNNVLQNASAVDASVLPKKTLATAADLQSMTVTFSGTNTYVFTLSLDSGESLVCMADFLSAGISTTNDSSSIFLSSDAGVGFYISKSASSAVVTLKNRMGSSKVVEIKSITARVAAVTAWT